jgi:hypothetical protein
MDRATLQQLFYERMSAAHPLPAPMQEQIRMLLDAAEAEGLVGEAVYDRITPEVAALLDEEPTLFRRRVANSIMAERMVEMLDEGWVYEPERGTWRDPKPSGTASQ